MALELPRLEERVTRLEALVDQILERLNHIETRLDEGLREVRGELSTRFSWLLGVVIATWITTTGMLVTILLKMK